MNTWGSDERFVSYDQTRQWLVRSSFYIFIYLYYFRKFFTTVWLSPSAKKKLTTLTQLVQLSECRCSKEGLQKRGRRVADAGWGWNSALPPRSLTPSAPRNGTTVYFPPLYSLVHFDHFALEIIELQPFFPTLIKASFLHPPELNGSSYSENRRARWTRHRTYIRVSADKRRSKKFDSWMYDVRKWNTPVDRLF